MIAIEEIKNIKAGTILKNYDGSRFVQILYKNETILTFTGVVIFDKNIPEYVRKDIIVQVPPGNGWNII